MKLSDNWLTEMKKRGWKANDPLGDKFIGGREKGRLSPEASVKRKAAHTWGKMNATEARYAAVLAATYPQAQVYFERVTLTLGHDCRYTPDFAVRASGDDVLSFHEVKGRRRWDDAMVKLRVAATAFPIFRFYLCEEIDGEWRAKLVPPA